MSPPLSRSPFSSALPEANGLRPDAPRRAAVGHGRELGEGDLVSFSTMLVVMVLSVTASNIFSAAVRLYVLARHQAAHRTARTADPAAAATAPAALPMLASVLAIIL